MRYLFFISLIAFIGKVQAQDGFKYANIKGGWISKQAVVFTGAIEFSEKYHALTEVFAEYYKNTTDKHETYMAGVAIKPVLTRSKNATLRYKVGGGIGANGEKFIAAPFLGLEFTKSLEKIDLILAQRNQLVFWENKENRWRWGVEIGVRMAIN